jgi:lipoprotein-anchoring transpeptidase ErfK/SrfK
MVGVAAAVTFATDADASTPIVPLDVTTTTTAAPTTTVAPLVIDQPGMTPRRGTQLQVTATVPPPVTTTTLPPDQLPANSGTGRRVVYSKPRQRVWTVEADGTVSKTHLVSGRLTYNQPSPGTYSVFSKSMFTCNIKNPAICWRYMVRFAIGGDEGDNIGFHEIPKKNGVPVQSVSQLGTPLSGGCVRQATSDAIYMWDWAPVGTRVVVLG